MVKKLSEKVDVVSSDDDVRVLLNDVDQQIQDLEEEFENASEERKEEIEKGRFVGKGSLSDTDELPDGRRITKHSFWFPKMFIKKIYDGDEDWASLI